jgi:hypothetical protein
LATDIVVVVHPDYQHTPCQVTALASMLSYDVYDVVLGSRIIGGALKGGMPPYKYVANCAFTLFFNGCTGSKFESGGLIQPVQAAPQPTLAQTVAAGGVHASHWSDSG